LKERSRKPAADETAGTRYEHCVFQNCIFGFFE
jgi:hypothetical protein